MFFYCFQIPFFKITKKTNKKSLIHWKNYKVIIRINCKDKEQSYVIYRYFSTVVYVAIAYTNGLTREIDNYENVYSFFKGK